MMIFRIASNVEFTEHKSKIPNECLNIPSYLGIPFVIRQLELRIAVSTTLQFTIPEARQHYDLVFFLALLFPSY